MEMSRPKLVIALMIAVGAFASPELYAQQTDQHQHHDMEQGHMAQMQGMLKRMDDINERASRLVQEMAKHKETGQDQAMESHRAMWRMEESMAVMAEQMEGFMLDAQMMMLDEALMGDPEMQADMEYLSEHFYAATRWMEGALEVMERMHERAPHHGSGS